MSSRFDLNTSPTESTETAPEKIDDIPPTPSKTNEPKFITLPIIGIKLTVIQLGIMVATLIGSTVFVLNKNKSPQANTTPQFASQELIEEKSSTNSSDVLLADTAPEPLVSSTPANPENISTTEDNNTIAQDINNLLTYSENNREGLKALDQRLRSLEQQIYALQHSQPTSQPSPSAVMSKATARPARQIDSRKVKFQGASISSLYPGLAWVNYKGSTWALRQGDRIGNATVQTIDIHKREVITTAGIIR
ncbi:hypothetical protein ACP179_01670 (plasmid) [Xenorhabdus stockiae]|uniref:hypothetical protein n=1 Tax=Xenorhabdus stockiae TaxID=351614 RepID=UPI003CF1BC9E